MHVKTEKRLKKTLDMHSKGFLIHTLIHDTFGRDMNSLLERDRIQSSFR